MLTRNDLDEAVRTGLITAAQAEALLALPLKRHEARQAQTLRDERFVFMRSFNEFFIALGVVLLGIGLLSASTGETQTSTALAFAFPVVIWGLAEYLTARKRFTLPSIVLAVLFSLSIWRLAGHFPDIFPDTGSQSSLFGSRLIMHWQSFAEPLAMTLGSVLFYWRFRLPFSLLVITASAVPLILVAFERLIGWPNQASLNIALIVIGLLVFAAALRFDMSDRERLTRRADCGFWLMLAAAPLIVHPVVTLLTNGEFTGMAANLVTLLAVAVFAFVALVVDRRAFLVSSLAYLGAAMVAGIGAIAGEGNALWATLIVMGAAVVLLGVGWQGARAFVMRPIPTALSSHLPIIRSS